MKNFTFQNPTKLIFGKDQIAKISSLIPKDKRLLLTFGGGSIRNNGVYEQVTTALVNHNYIEFWGIEPNPSVETLRKAIALGKENDIEFILAVGGGSVIDGTKLIAAGILYDGDAWDIVVQGKADECIPYASILTLPATGSEMNSGSVISRAATKEKYAFMAQFPVFSILDPQTTYSLPTNQIANGLADTFVHVMEQYLTTIGQSRIMDRWAEGLLSTVIEIAPKIKENQHDYDTMADFMLSATLALNDFIRIGVIQDWATHMIGHELTALTGISHGASLAIVLPGTMYVMKQQKKLKILQYAERIFNITQGTDEEKVDLAIKKTEEFFQSLGLATTLTEAKIDNSVIDTIANRFLERGTVLGENRNITGDVVREILENRK